MSNDDTPTQSKTWNWDSSDPTAKFRYAVTQTFDWVPVGDYSDIKTATQDIGDGIYWLHVQAIDEIGNESSLTIVSAVLDNTSPVAVLSGTPPNPTNQTTTDITVSGDGVTYYKYKLDDGEYSGETIVDTHIQLSDLTDGEHTLSVIGRDEAGNWQSEENATVYTWTVDTVPEDTTPPVITLLGDNPVNLYVGDSYTDDGATAIDDVDGDITDDIITINPVDTNTIGTYTITYNVSDSAENPADEKTRMVIVSEAPQENTPPEMQSVILLPNSAYTNSNIATIAIALDDDIMDIVTLSYQWKKNGENVGENSLTLLSDNFVKGDKIKVVVTPNDGTVDGEPMESDPIIISNSAPTQPTVSISPNPAYTDNDLTCNASGSTDTDDDTLSYLYQWYKNDILQDGYISGTLLASQTEAGDVWKCEVVADDEESQSDAGESSVTILEEQDLVPPTVISLTHDHDDLIVRNADNVEITVIFSENMLHDPNTIGPFIRVQSPTPNVYFVIPMVGSETTWHYTWNVPELYNGPGEVTVLGSDLAGNAYEGTDSIIFTIDNTIPEITLEGDAIVNLNVGNSYIDAGVTASDNIDGDISGEIVIDDNAVDTNTAGTYTITYNVSDEAGNEADEVIRIVIVSEAPDITLPDAVSTLDVSNISNHTLKLNWTATGDDGNTGTASSYDIRYLTTEITNENWNEAIQISSPSAPDPKEAGTDQSVEVNGLKQGTIYYFAMKVSDEVPNESEISNVVSATTKTPPPQNTGGGGNNNNPPTSVLSSNNPLKILSTQKGTLNQDLNNENKVKVEIPKGSVKSTTTFTASEGSLEEGDVPENKIGAFLFNGLVFNIEAVDTNGKAVKEFSENLTITLTIPNLPDDTSNLELYYFDDESGEWVIISDVEFGDGVITFKVNHLTQFALFEIPEPVVEGAATTNIIDGDIIQCKSSDNPFAVYVVKIAGGTKYIRHIVSLEIFNYYGHLKWENLKQVDSLNNYSLSGWVRYNTGENYAAAPTDKVYEINGDSTKHWINMAAEQFFARGGSEPAIFNINQGELNLYISGADVMYK